MTRVIYPALLLYCALVFFTTISFAESKRSNDVLNNEEFLTVIGKNNKTSQETASKKEDSPNDDEAFFGKSPDKDYTAEEDYRFLVLLARNINHKKISDNLFKIIRKMKKSDSFPVHYGALGESDYKFLISLAKSISDPQAAERLVQISGKIRR
jgi:hypothetical protein